MQAFGIAASSTVSINTEPPLCRAVTARAGGEAEDAEAENSISMKKTKAGEKN